MPRCSRCLRQTEILSRLILHVDTDQRDRETAYFDLCNRCVVQLTVFMETPDAQAGTDRRPH